MDSGFRWQQMNSPPAVDGSDVKLTINTDIQYFAQQAIQSQVNKMNAEWGSIIVIDTKTGNLIALLIPIRRTPPMTPPGRLMPRIAASGR